MVNRAPQSAAYIRVSSDKQDVTRQKDSIARWAEQHGAVDLWFEDSIGRNPRDQAFKRAEFQRLMRAVEAGEICRIVVDSQDRFGSKDAYEWGKFVSLLRDNDCQLFDSTGRELTADDDGNVLTTMVGALASTREQKEKAHRNVSGKITRARKGEYQGGNPPYGFDVVCFSADGHEKWRSVYDGHYKRLKVYADGTRERFDGKDNSPRKDATDSMELRPSIEKERIKNAQRIFEWYSTEAISPAQIATRLNRLKIDPIFGDKWNKVKIAALLHNPVYIGFPTWNKRGGGRFAEYVGGQIRPVARKGGKAVLGRPRSTDDYVQAAKPQFDPIIASSVWGQVQNKSKRASEKQKSIPRRAAQTDELWLKPFLICGQCGKPMRATAGRSAKAPWPSYFCGTYGTYGKDNATGCHCHRMHHKVIERYLDQYIADVFPKVKQLIAGQSTARIDSDSLPLLIACNDAMQVERSLEIMRQQLFDDFSSPKRFAELSKAGKSIEQIYETIYSEARPTIEKRIAEKEKELDKLLDSYADLTGGVRDRARSKLEIIQTEIDDLKERLIDLRHPFELAKTELRARENAIKTAKKALSTGVDGRRKAEAVSSVIESIVCHFDHKTGLKTNGRSRLVKLEFQPVSGDALNIVTKGSKLGPG